MALLIVCFVCLFVWWCLSPLSRISRRSVLLVEEYNNQRHRCDITWLPFTNHLYHGFPWNKYYIIGFNWKKQQQINLIIIWLQIINVFSDWLTPLVTFFDKTLKSPCNITSMSLIIVWLSWLFALFVCLFDGVYRHFQEYHGGQFYW
jgi:hypothetical protein